MSISSDFLFERGVRSVPGFLDTDMEWFLQNSLFPTARDSQEQSIPWRTFLTVFTRNSTHMLSAY